MQSLSVIVPVQNNASVLAQTLQSVEDALAHFQHRRWTRDVACEVVVVDDGSADASLQVASEFARDRDGYRVIGRPAPSSAGTARNLGVAASRGAFLFFLDGDDRFLEPHISECYRVMADPAVPFVKTGVCLADPVHPEWRLRIRNSLVINLCLRRRCHEAIGGFPDYHLFRRQGDRFRHELDLFRGIEDGYYNILLHHFFQGAAVPLETVTYLRYPGNSFDRQYEKFQVAPGEFRGTAGREQALQVKLCGIMLDHILDSPP